MSSSNPVRRIRNAAFEKAAPELAEHAEAIRKLGKRILSDVLEIGKRLTKARTLIAHGDWLRWLESEFQWSDETARRFMDVYETSKNHNLWDLQVPVSALYALARVPKEIRDEIVAQCNDGESRSLADVQRVIAEARAVTVPAASHYVTRAEDTRVYLTPPEPATTVVVRLDGEFANAQRLIVAIEAYGAALTDGKKSALQAAAMEVGRDRAAIRRCIDIIMAAIGDEGVSR